MTGPLNPQTIRIPNLPIGQITDKNGQGTDDEMTFRHTLITNLQRLMGNEGLVAPLQDSTNIATIQNNTTKNPATGANVPTCAPGTIIYNTTNDTLMVAVLVAGVPTFKTFTVT